jgi:hypothetical protein
MFVIPILVFGDIAASLPDAWIELPDPQLNHSLRKVYFVYCARLY